MRSGTIQLQLDNGEIGLGRWWSGTGREASGLLRRHLPAFSLEPRALADLLDGDSELLVVRLGGRSAAVVCPAAEVRVRAARLALTVAPSGWGVRRQRLTKSARNAKTEAA